MIESIGAALLPHDQTEYDRNVAALRTQLDDASFNAAWEAGCKLTLEQAIKLAVGNDQ